MRRFDNDNSDVSKETRETFAKIGREQMRKWLLRDLYHTLVRPDLLFTPFNLLIWIFGLRYISTWNMVGRQRYIIGMLAYKISPFKEFRACRDPHIDLFHWKI